jgi:hypothetical protein
MTTTTTRSTDHMTTSYEIRTASARLLTTEAQLEASKQIHAAVKAITIGGPGSDPLVATIGRELLADLIADTGDAVTEMEHDRQHRLDILEALGAIAPR